MNKSNKQLDGLVLCRGVGKLVINLHHRFSSPLLAPLSLLATSPRHCYSPRLVNAPRHFCHPMKPAPPLIATPRHRHSPSSPLPFIAAPSAISSTPFSSHFPARVPTSENAVTRKGPGTRTGSAHAVQHRAGGAFKPRCPTASSSIPAPRWLRAARRFCLGVQQRTGSARGAGDGRPSKTGSFSPHFRWVPTLGLGSSKRGAT